MKEIDQLVSIGVMKWQPYSQWASPSFIIPKKDLTVRTISDFRELNKRIVRKPYPIPKISTMLQELEGFTYATALDFLVVFYRVIYRVITKFYPKPLIWARVAVKCTIAVKLPPLLAYPTLPYLTAVQKSAFQYHQKSTEQQRYLQRNDTKDTIVCGKITAVALWWRAARWRRRWR